MKIYFAGSIRGGRDDSALYEEIISYLKKYGTVLTEHIGDAELSVAGEITRTPKYIHDRDTEWIKEADILIVEVTSPSLGVGYEIAYAGNLGKEIHCFFRENTDKKLSFMIEGSEYCSIHKYKEKEEIFKSIDEIFNK